MHNKDYVLFLRSLNALGGSCGQTTLKRKLRWNQIKFNQIKNELVEQEFIIKGKGRGGSVQLNQQGLRYLTATSLHDSSTQFDLPIQNDDDDSDACILIPPPVDSWQNIAVEELRDLPKKDLLAIISGGKNSGDIINLLNSKLNDLGKSRKVNRREIALALTYIYGKDLLFNPETREKARDLIAKHKGIRAPKRLTPGKKEAIRFVIEADLPEEMAGQEKTSNREAFVVINGRERSYKPLQPYQNELVERALEKFQNTDMHARALISLPTGAGKTRTAVEIVHCWMDRLIISNKFAECNLTIWVAQSDELCEQAFNQFQEVWENNPQVLTTKIVRLWGGFWKEEIDVISTNLISGRMPTIMICTINTLHAILMKPSSVTQKGFAQIIKEDCDFIIIDEAHHAAARTYRETYEEISMERKSQDNGLNLLGLTATPYRNTNERAIEELRKIFSDILIPSKSFPNYDETSPIQSFKRFLQSEGVLSTEHVLVEKTQIKLKIENDKKPFDESYTSALEDSNKRHDRRKFIADKIKAIVDENKNHLVIYFGSSIGDAKLMASLLLMEGIPTGFVGDKTGPDAREGIINDFKTGNIKVLTNCKILQAGFDAPKITHVILGWPTSSTVLFQQMIGRGLRGPKFGGTDVCKVSVFCDDLEGLKDHTLAHEEYVKEWGLK